MDTVWKDIPGYEGKYQANAKGEIKNLSRMVRGKTRTGSWFLRKVPDHILKSGQYCKNGHVSVVLGKGTNGKPVHQLVMLTFVGPAPSGMEVRHINGNPKDNRLENLQYGSRTENILDVYYQGKRWRKLSINDVKEIRKRIHYGEKGSDIVKVFNLSQSSISAIKHGRTFRWLK